MRKIFLFLCVLFIVFSMTGVAGAVPVYLDGVSASTGWSDADKTGSDSLLCWAASASNALDYTGWTGTNDGVDSISAADDIYAYFKSYWPNDTGNAYYAHEWWFTGTESDPDTTPTGGGGFYTTEWPSVNAYFDTWMDSDVGIDAMDTINTFIGENRGITIDIDAGVGHAITVWGINMADTELYITDSDDLGDSLRTFQYSLGFDGYYYIDDYINGNWQQTAVSTKITGLTGLTFNIDDIDPYYDDDDNGGPTGVPEPATLFLMGIGLIGLAGFRRKFLR